MAIAKSDLRFYDAQGQEKEFTSVFSNLDSGPCLKIHKSSRCIYIHQCVSLPQPEWSGPDDIFFELTIKSPEHLFEFFEAELRFNGVPVDFFVEKGAITSPDLCTFTLRANSLYSLFSGTWDFSCESDISDNIIDFHRVSADGRVIRSISEIFEFPKYLERVRIAIEELRKIKDDIVKIASSV